MYEKGRKKLKRKIWKKITALGTTAILLFSMPSAVWAAEIFSSGVDAFEDEDLSAEDLFSDETSPQVLLNEETVTENQQEDYTPSIYPMIPPIGKVGESYSYQLSGDGYGRDIVWGLTEGSVMPPGLTLTESGLISGVPEKIGEYVVFITASVGTAQSMTSLHIEIQEVIPEYRIALEDETRCNLGIVPAGEKRDSTITLINTGTKAVEFAEPPSSEYFNLEWYDYESAILYPESSKGLYVQIKTNLPPGKYEEKVPVKTIEGAECEMLLKVIIGPASENDYDLTFNPAEIHFGREEFETGGSYVTQRLRIVNSGKKETKISLDVSGLKYFNVRNEEYESEEETPLILPEILKPSQAMILYVSPKNEYGSYQESLTFYTEDGSSFPLVMTMEREEKLPPIKVTPTSIRFEEKTVKYKELPKAETVTVENVSKEQITLGLNHLGKLQFSNLSKSVLEPGEKAEFTVRPVYGLGVGITDASVHITCVRADGTSVGTSVPTYFKVNNLLFSGALPIKPIKNVANGAAKTAAGLHLPKTVEVYGENKKVTYKSNVSWDVAHCDYNPKNKKAQSFKVEGELLLEPGRNNDDLDTKVSIEVSVNKYDPLGAPVWQDVTVINNYVKASLADKVNQANGYQFVTVKKTSDLAKGKYTASTQASGIKANVKYLAKGTHYLYCRGYQKGKNGTKYGAWSKAKKITVNAVTPAAPVIQKATVKNCDIMLNIRTPKKVNGFDVVLAKSKNGTEPGNYALVRTAYAGGSKQILLNGAPKGTYYVGVHSYRTDSGSKVLSRWSNLMKVTVKNGAVTAAPVVKKLTVSGKNVTVQSALPKGTQGYDWALGTECEIDTLGNPVKVSNYVNIQKNKTSSKITFKNLKPGTYYLYGHAYVKGYKKNFTEWSKIRKIVIK